MSRYYVGGIDKTTEALGRLAQIAELLSPCPEPGFAQGYDLCVCGSGEVWPCAVTRAAWLARGTEVSTEVRKVNEAVRAELYGEFGGEDW